MRLFQRNSDKNRSRRPFNAQQGTARRYGAGMTYYRHDPGQDVSVSLKKKKTDTTIHQTQRSFTLGKVINFVIIACIVFLAFFASTLSSRVTILTPDGSFQYRSEAEYENAAREIMNSSLLDKSKILFRTSEFEDAFIQRFPEIRRAEAIMPLGGRDLTLSLGMAAPLGVVLNGTDTAIIDESGVLTVKNPSNTAAASTQQLTTIRFAQRQENFDVGQRLLTTEEVNLIKTIQRELANQKVGNDLLEIKEYALSIANGQLLLSFQTVPFYIKFSTYGDPLEQVGKLKATINNLQREGAMPAIYIDVRVEGRVYVL